MFVQATVSEVDRRSCHAWCRASTQETLLMSLSPQPNSEALESPRAFGNCCINWLMSSEPSTCLCNFLALEEVCLEMVLLSSGIGGRASALLEHVKIMRGLVMFIFLRFSVLLRYLDIPRNPRSADKKDCY